MSEEKEGGFFGQIKNQIITGVGVAITAGSTLFLDVVKEKLGISEPEPPATEQVETATSQPNIVINMPEQKEQKKDTVVKKVYVKPKPKKTETEKRKDEGFDW
jgi:hypothetical protein